LVIADGRRGTRVAPRPAVRARAHVPSPAVPSGTRDLTIGFADPELLPPLGPVLEEVAKELPPADELLEPRQEELLRFARSWFTTDAVPADAIAVTAGAFDGLERVLAAHLRPGDRVVIEDPAYPPIRDLLAALGLVASGVAVDQRGLVPDALERALAAGPAAIVLVPRAQNPTGAALDAERAATIRALLSAYPELLVVEDDHVSLVAGAPFHSAIDAQRGHWAIVRSLSKVLHPDLRLALVAGDETTIARVEGRQLLGPRWVSHLLQATAAKMLGASEFDAHCARAGAAYSARRRAMIDALAAHGIAAVGSAGLNVWVPVREETTVVRGLGEAGWLVLAGERFRIEAPPAVRITIATLRDGEADQIAAAFGEIVRTGRGSGY
jgi:DNA-binding transcriptional MocR family regulator